MGESKLALATIAELLEQLSVEERAELLESLLIGIVCNPNGLASTLQEYVQLWRFDQVVKSIAPNNQ